MYGKNIKYKIPILMLLPKESSSNSVACSESNRHCEHPCPKAKSISNKKQTNSIICVPFFIFSSLFFALKYALDFKTKIFNNFISQI